MQTAHKGEGCTELPAYTVFLPCEPALLKEFLESYFIQKDWGFLHPIGSAQLYPHQHLHGPIRAMPFGPSKLWAYGVLICMRMNQSGARVGDFCLYKPAPLWLGECTLPFHWRQDYVSHTDLNTKDVSLGRSAADQHGQSRLLNGADQSGAKQSSLAQSRPARSRSEQSTGVRRRGEQSRAV